MIIKERKIPLRIEINKALLRRLPTNHPKRSKVEADLAKRQAGYNGELSLDYHLSFLPNEQFLIMHDLRLTNGTYPFQIDTLILSPYIFIILEVKNISGTIFFDKNFQQMLRTINGVEEGFQDPLIQAKRQKLQLTDWLKNRNITDIPIEYLIVVSNPSTVLKTNFNHGSVLDRVCHAAHLIDKIEKYTTLYKIEKLCQKSLRKLTRILLKSHSEEPLNLYDIPQKDLLT